MKRKYTDFYEEDRSEKKQKETTNEDLVIVCIVKEIPEEYNNDHYVIRDFGKGVYFIYRKV